MAMNAAAGQQIVIDDGTLWTYIGDILYGNEDQHIDSRAAALSSLYQLLRQPETLPDLAPILWCSPGIMTVLLSEIVNVYPKLKTAAFTANDMNRVSHSLRLVQRLVSHKETKYLFLQAQLPFFLYPFLNAARPGRAYELLRINALHVFVCLVQVDDNEVASFLVQTEIIPLCLRIMEKGTDGAKTQATYIIQRLLLNRTGLNYVCHTAERFYAVARVLAKMVDVLLEAPSGRIFNQVICCYTRLSGHPTAREVLK